MADKATTPSINQADVDSLPGVLKLVLQKHLANTDDMLPAKVLSYNRSTNRARVQPLIALVTTDGKFIPRAAVASVPVLQIGGGGFLLSFPIQAGDLGWIKATDRDISLFKRSMAQVQPNTARKHSFEDAMFIPDVMMKGVTIDSTDASSVVLQNLSGTVKVALGANKLTLKAPQVVIDTPNLTMSNSSGSINIGGINFLTHKHTGVQPGGGNTGNPI